MVELCDAFVLDGVRRTSDGYLAAYANVARTGIQIYKGKELGRPDLGDVRVYRPPSEVFHKDAMKSMAHRPVTLNHPSETVNAKNWLKYAKGHTGDEVIRDGDHVRVPMVVMDAATIRRIEDASDGARELSMGYSTDLKWKPGKTPSGETYDAVQTAIRANHLAIVPVARGGATLKIGDAACPKCGMDVPSDADECPYCQEVLDAIESADPAEHEHDPEADKLLRVMAKRKSTPQEKRAAAEALMNFLTENYGDDEGKSRYASLTAGMKMTDASFADKDFTASRRKALAKTGAAMPDGSFPIENTSDLSNAVSSYGHKATPAVKAHIIKRARALGAESELPDDWVKSRTKDAAFGANKGEGHMTAIVVIDGARIEVADELSASVINKHCSDLHGAAADLKNKLDKTMADKEEAAEEAARQQKDAKTALDAATGEIAVLKKQLSDAQSLNSPEKLDQLVKDRMAVTDAASCILPAGFVFDGKTVLDIRKAAVAVKLGDAVKDMSDAAIEGAFKALTADAARSGPNRLADAISKAQSAGHRPGEVDVRDAAMADREKYLTNAWRTPAKTN